jgi:hypothetical protein
LQLLDLSNEDFRCYQCQAILNENNWLHCRRKRNQKICKDCIAKDNNERYDRNKELYAESKKIAYQIIKTDIITYYGGQCIICGESNQLLLSLDHIDGNGRQHRKEVLGIDSGTGFYKWVLDNKPDNLRLLCYNCNCQTKMTIPKIPADLTSKEKEPFRKRARRIALKIRAFQAYGGCCQECGIDKLEFLTIDHINNDGAEHRREIGPDIYPWLENNNFPEGFQILCFNCNYMKHFQLKLPH